MKKVLEEIMDSLMSLVETTVGLSVFWSVLISSCVALLIGFMSYRQSHRIFIATLRRNSLSQSSSDVTKLITFIQAGNIKGRSIRVGSGVTAKKAEEFEVKNMYALADLNNLCASFTSTGRLAEEQFGYENIGWLFTEYVKKYYPLIEYISNNERRYRDIVLLYELWDSRIRIARIDNKLKRLVKKFQKAHHYFTGYRSVGHLFFLLRKTISPLTRVDALNHLRLFVEVYGEYKEAKKELKTAIMTLRKEERLHKKLAKKHHNFDY